MCSLTQTSAKPSSSACTAARRIASGLALRPIWGRWMPTCMSANSSRCAGEARASWRRRPGECTPRVRPHVALRQPGEETIDPLQCLWLRTEHHPQFTIAAAHHARRHRAACLRQFDLDLRAGWHASSRWPTPRRRVRRSAASCGSPGGPLLCYAGHDAVGGDAFVTPAFVGGVVTHRDQELIDLGAQGFCLAADFGCA